jgi:hypothetical protein
MLSPMLAAMADLGSLFRHIGGKERPPRRQAVAEIARRQYGVISGRQSPGLDSESIRYDGPSRRDAFIVYIAASTQ